MGVQVVDVFHAAGDHAAGSAGGVVDRAHDAFHGQQVVVLDEDFEVSGGVGSPEFPEIHRRGVVEKCFASRSRSFTWASTAIEATAGNFRSALRPWWGQERTPDGAAGQRAG